MHVPVLLLYVVRFLIHLVLSFAQSILLDVLCPLLNDNQTVLLLAVVETNPR